MSSTKPTPVKEPASLQTTRQMLDELDALMERMLALPVNDLEDATPADIVRLPTVSATLTVLDSPLADQEMPPPEEESGPLQEPSPPVSFPGYSTDITPEPSAPVLEEPPALSPEPIPEEMIPPPVMTLSAPTVKILPVRRRSLGNLGLLPLFWFNKVFDLGTLMLGPPGRWLRGSHGRHYLGMSGLVLLVAAGVWLLKDWLGWTW